MSEPNWPKWIRLLYFKDADSSINGYEGCANNAFMLLDIFNRLGVRMLDIVEMKVNDQKLSEEDIVKFYKWLAQKRREIEVNEEREKSNIKSEKNN